MALTASGIIPVNFTGAPPAPPATVSADNGTQQIVQDGWAAAQVYANNAYNAATNYLANLEHIAMTIGSPVIDPNLATLDLNLAQFDHLLGTAPIAPANTFAFTEIPYS